MLFADAQPETWVQVVAIVATAVVGAWTTIRVKQLDRQSRRQRRRAAEERKRCDGLEHRVAELETALRACVRSRKPRRPKSRPAD